jgi:hypothetical protein
VLLPVATSTASRSSISRLTTKRLTSTLYDIILVLFSTIINSHFLVYVIKYINIKPLKKQIIIQYLTGATVIISEFPRI